MNISLTPYKTIINEKRITMSFFLCPLCKTSRPLWLIFFYHNVHKVLHRVHNDFRKFAGFNQPKLFRCIFCNFAPCPSKN